MVMLSLPASPFVVVTGVLLLEHAASAPNTASVDITIANAKNHNLDTIVHPFAMDCRLRGSNVSRP
jgi:hypothetical protein